MAGNANSGRKQEKPFADALRMEIAEAGENHKQLRAIARTLIVKAAEGDMQAIKEFADRLDGKPAVQVNHGGNPENPILANVGWHVVDKKS